MATASQLAAALLAKQDAAGPAVDLLWERAGASVHSTPLPPSSPERALKVAKSSLDAALALVPVLTDPVALDLVARKDDRKRVRRLVAVNPHASRGTLLFLLSWSLRPRVLDEDLFGSLLRREELGWSDFAPVLRDAAELPPISWYQLAIVVRRAASLEAYRSALSLQLRELSEFLLQDVLDGSVEGLSFEEFLSLASGSDLDRQQFLGSILTSWSKKVSPEIARLIVAELPRWSSFPVLSFRQVTSSGKELSPEVVEIFDAARDSRTDQVLAASRGVSEEVLLRLLENVELRPVVAGHRELPLSVLEVLAEDPVREVNDHGWSNRVSSAALLVGRDLPEHLASRLLGRLAAGEFNADSSRIMITMRSASSEARLSYLRARGSWSLTKFLLLGQAGPVSAEEIRSLFEVPGQAFAHNVSGAGYGTYERVVPSTRDEVAQVVVADLDAFAEKPWTFDLLDHIPGLLGSVEITRRFAPYLWDRLAPVRESRHLLEAFLSLAPEWTGTLPELVDVVLLTA